MALMNFFKGISERNEEARKKALLNAQNKATEENVAESTDNKPSAM